ncbi:DUF3592 domain-containing protein [Streptomyces olivochromogenes]|uniref:DUF3592 domain-containing protein n=1 Tax=Streptomyces olivochromogenes TaxID=1963 RepID=UPI001F259151|nr:DUF3592 domain-containing protein [Streptomyces olivochromogenes]MCF3135140.1 DUF3592 domain-containing protein [Streptomyces olivochromogenes]
MSAYWLLALVPFIAGLAVTGHQARLAITEHLLRRTGRRVEGTVTGHIASREGTYAALHPVIRWVGEDGGEYERAVPDTIGAHALPEGSRVHLLCTPGSPDTVALDNLARYRSAVLGMWLGVLLWAGALTAVLIRIATLLPEPYRY